MKHIWLGLLAATAAWTGAAARTMYSVQPVANSAPRFERVTMPWGYIDGDGQPHYYIADYQGNIRVVSDRNGNVEQATDYYPYGMPMATSIGAEVNRYKYSGKELETRNGLNFYDFAARLHFPAINLMNQPDVNAGDYNWLNPYLYCAANPINITDPTGQILQIKDSNSEVYTIQIEDNAIVLYNAKNERFSPDVLHDFFLSDMLSINLNELIQTNIGMKIVSGIINSDKVVNLTFANKDNKFKENGTIQFDPYDYRVGIGYDKNVGIVTSGSSTINLCHEMAHAYDWVKGTMDRRIWTIIEHSSQKQEVVYRSELFACHIENIYRKEIGFPHRDAYAKQQLSDGTIIPIFSTFLPFYVTNND